MVFSSLFFIFFFLLVTIALYGAVPGSWRNHVLLIASCVFYSWGAPQFVFVLLASIGADYVLAREIAGAGSMSRKKRLLAAGLVLNLGLLFYFKYANFFVDQVNGVLEMFGGEAFAWTEVVLPIGISFFTFQKISYLVDVYRGSARPATSVASYALYVALFPQLIAGPIIRYHDIAMQLVVREHSWERIYSGVCRFCFGLGKKVLIANSLGEVADAVFALPAAELSPQVAWLGALCYTLQIYFDFSGYSDMAIGLGRIFGFDYLENFNQPYLSKNFTEFWRRWHISLSNWMREYLYIPLGGNRKGTLRLCVNLWLVFLFSGFWHGASWTFIAWGAYHGFFLSFDKVRSRWKHITLPPPLAMPITFVFLMFGWVLFRSETLPDAWSFIQRMLMLTAPAAGTEVTTPGMIADSRHLAVLALAAFLSFTPVPAWLRDLSSLRTNFSGNVRTLAVGVVSLMVFVIATSILSTESYNPFIYFRF